MKFIKNNNNDKENIIEHYTENNKTNIIIGSLCFIIGILFAGFIFYSLYIKKYKFTSVYIILILFTLIMLIAGIALLVESSK